MQVTLKQTKEVPENPTSAKAAGEMGHLGTNITYITLPAGADSGSTHTFFVHPSPSPPWTPTAMMTSLNINRLR